ncbi:hypothetical protein IscW_ISCW002224 [Ixodes scapularis]|uniref:Uncharacterized protein n=1 Tax=Ixodes scapularis TaxID=6945 RepID=B7PDS4_IXOSC|nr:hypothetical protein IscW_ISCW002224 [Ixodes scapularis]|eukprot:XP_002411032.1 hypothetical protein IscW_ISCW002224 [Ixodes scapularis]
MLRTVASTMLFLMHEPRRNCEMASKIASCEPGFGAMASFCSSLSPRPELRRRQEQEKPLREQIVAVKFLSGCMKFSSLNADELGDYYWFPCSSQIFNDVPGEQHHMFLGRVSAVRSFASIQTLFKYA